MPHSRLSLTFEGQPILAAKIGPFFLGVQINRPEAESSCKEPLRLTEAEAARSGLFLDNLG